MDSRSISSGQPTSYGNVSPASDDPNKWQASRETRHNPRKRPASPLDDLPDKTTSALTAGVFAPVEPADVAAVASALKQVPRRYKAEPTPTVPSEGSNPAREEPAIGNDPPPGNAQADSTPPAPDPQTILFLDSVSQAIALLDGLRQRLQLPESRADFPLGEPTDLPGHIAHLSQLLEAGTLEGIQNAVTAVEIHLEQLRFDIANRHVWRNLLDPYTDAFPDADGPMDFVSAVPIEGRPHAQKNMAELFFEACNQNAAIEQPDSAASEISRRLLLNDALQEAVALRRMRQKAPKRLFSDNGCDLRAGWPEGQLKKAVRRMNECILAHAEEMLTAVRGPHRLLEEALTQAIATFRTAKQDPDAPPVTAAAVASQVAVPLPAIAAIDPYTPVGVSRHPALAGCPVDRHLCELDDLPIYCVYLSDGEFLNFYTLPMHPDDATPAHQCQGEDDCTIAAVNALLMTQQGITQNQLLTPGRLSRLLERLKQPVSINNFGVNEVKHWLREEVPALTLWTTYIGRDGDRLIVQAPEQLHVPDQYTALGRASHAVVTYNKAGGSVGHTVYIRKKGGVYTLHDSLNRTLQHRAADDMVQAIAHLCNMDTPDAGGNIQQNSLTVMFTPAPE